MTREVFPREAVPVDAVDAPDLAAPYDALREYLGNLLADLGTEDECCADREPIDTAGTQLGRLIQWVDQSERRALKRARSDHHPCVRQRADDPGVPPTFDA